MRFTWNHKFGFRFSHASNILQQANIFMKIKISFLPWCSHGQMGAYSAIKGKLSRASSIRSSFTVWLVNDLYMTCTWPVNCYKRTIILTVLLWFTVLRNNNWNPKTGDSNVGRADEMTQMAFSVDDPVFILYSSDYSLQNKLTGLEPTALLIRPFDPNLF